LPAGGPAGPRAAPPGEGRAGGQHREWGTALKYLPFVLKHLRRNWIRTTSTAVAMATVICVSSTLRSGLAEVNGPLESTSASRLVTRHAVSLVFNLPRAYA